MPVSLDVQFTTTKLKHMHDDFILGNFNVYFFLIKIIRIIKEKFNKNNITFVIMSQMH